ncbi:MotA/TolQ/ExbB proton channel family protein [Vibrio sp. ZSDZ34]|uniref:MotA/TolQ/ExbB proton channel family protein n=1 Tax=Vibrio gelatinilyticus TaxID=2893468 RepID=A0A9X1WB54_9VIBR|nr:MotA/TolQ/ExbB proton channel family protein [Vibrio gelatinilyticus]MCJ2375878.1 MotA/TolQ/ExbB proton channel family protein [Vibrio gelatinilyticus]
MPHNLFSWLPSSDHLNQFMTQGGPVLWWLAAVVFVFWLVAFERLIYFAKVFPCEKKHWVARWTQRQEHYSWYAQSQRNAMLSEAENKLKQNLNILKCLLSLCPMLGLLGTVTGMITVFDTLAVQGSAQPRLMAAGISMATIPTMAGMVAALSGMLAYSRIQKLSNKSLFQLEQLLRSEHHLSSKRPRHSHESGDTK